MIFMIYQSQGDKIDIFDMVDKRLEVMGCVLLL